MGEVTGPWLSRSEQATHNRLDVNGPFRACRFA